MRPLDSSVRSENRGARYLPWAPLSFGLTAGRDSTFSSPLCGECMRTGVVLSTAPSPLAHDSLQERSLRPRALLGLPSPPWPRGLAGRAAWPPRTAAPRRRPTRSASRPARGRESTTRRSQLSATRRRSPLPSLPSTSTTLPVRSTSLYGAGGARLGAVHPRARVAWPVASQSARFVTRATAQVLDRARRRLADGGGDRRRAPRRDHQPGGADGLGRAADRAQVAGVLDLVQRDHQGVRALEQRAGIGVGIRDQPRPRSPDGPANPPAGRAPPADTSVVVQTRRTRRRPRCASATGRRP